jgi:D-lactate dehydrogenase
MEVERLEMLRGVRFFASLDDEALSLVCAALERSDVAYGISICKEGDIGDEMFVVESGEVSVLKSGNIGEQVEITVLQAGDVAGEMSVLSKHVRSATLTARTDVVLLTLKGEVFQELLLAHPELSRILLSNLCTHLQRETSTVAKLMTRDADIRFKIAMFDNKSYMERAFIEANADEHFALQFIDTRLSIDTVPLAAGADAVCIFVNDDCDAPVVNALADMGIKLIALRCAGYNNVCLNTAASRGVSVVRVSAYSPYAVAEHAVALMMALNRKIHRANNRIREGNFSLSGLVGFDMHGRTAGVIGNGKIGRCTVSILKGFGCEVLAHSRTVDEVYARKAGIQYVSLNTLLAESDVISLHVPLFPQTCHMINAKTIALMKRGVMLINTSRGGLIDTVALLDGLKSGQIGYAGLDVYEEESGYFFEDYSDDVLNDDVLARLTTFNNVIVSSHQAFLTSDALAGIAETTLSNLRAYEAGARDEELPNLVCAQLK